MKKRGLPSEISGSERGWSAFSHAPTKDQTAFEKRLALPLISGWAAIELEKAKDDQRVKDALNSVADALKDPVTAKTVDLLEAVSGMDAPEDEESQELVRKLVYQVLDNAAAVPEFFQARSLDDFWKPLLAGLRSHGWVQDAQRDLVVWGVRIPYIALALATDDSERDDVRSRPVPLVASTTGEALRPPASEPENYPQWFGLPVPPVDYARFLAVLAPPTPLNRGPLQRFVDGVGQNLLEFGMMPSGSHQGGRIVQYFDALADRLPSLPERASAKVDMFAFLVSHAQPSAASLFRSDEWMDRWFGPLLPNEFALLDLLSDVQDFGYFGNDLFAEPPWPRLWKEFFERQHKRLRAPGVTISLATPVGAWHYGKKLLSDVLTVLKVPRDVTVEPFPRQSYFSKQSGSGWFMTGTGCSFFGPDDAVSLHETTAPVPLEDAVRLGLESWTKEDWQTLFNHMRPDWTPEVVEVLRSGDCIYVEAKPPLPGPADS